MQGKKTAAVVGSLPMRRMMAGTPARPSDRRQPKECDETQ